MEAREPVAALRSFSRFYTRLLALLEPHLRGTPVSLAEARVLFEIGHNGPCTASSIGALLGMDPGYLSRILTKFARGGLLGKERSSDDARALALSLTEKGRQLLDDLEAAANRQAESLLDRLSPDDRNELVVHLAAVRRLLSPAAERPRPQIRPCRPGEPGHLAFLHADVYRREYGFDRSFEAYVLHGMAEYLEKDASGSEVWVVEDEGRIVGGIGIVRADERTAQLRWFLLLPAYRGMGLGGELMKTALGFCSLHGYAQVFLWTVADLAAARSLYHRFGFRPTESVEHDIWGKHLLEERWDLSLV